MGVHREAYLRIREELDAAGVTLVAVSKTKPVADILELYELGQRDFGENYVQELTEKAAQLPADIRWHFIGHLQTNKVKTILPLVQLIHGVDSLKLLQEISKQSGRLGRVTDCLLQVHIAREETKFGLDEEELQQLQQRIAGSSLPFTRIRGLMGMASFTEDKTVVRGEFRSLKKIFDRLATESGPRFEMEILSMGMSGDYPIAVAEGSTLVRIGSLLFGERN